MNWKVGLIASWLACSSNIALASPDVSAEIEAGRAIYNFRCYYCHGYSGDARTLAASFLVPPPANFTLSDAASLTPEQIGATVREGRPGTAMKSFRGTINDADIRAVSQFIFDEFVVRKAENTRYHTIENGWPNHQRYQDAYPFATGEISLTLPWEKLTQAQSRGKRLYLESCVSCHDRGKLAEDPIIWDARPLSYPRNNFSFTAPPQPDAIASASPYAKHDVKPAAAGLSARERRGESLFQTNCAFCHAADGTGKNWIGQFLEPHPRNLRDSEFMGGRTRESLLHSIREGLSGTSMPAWKDVIQDRDIRDIIDYIARVFHPLPPWQAARQSSR